MNKQEMLASFAGDLQRENNKHNLVSRQATLEDIQQHIADCLAVMDIMSFDGLKTVDIGTGGGFPGLVLAIAFEKGSFTLIESDLKKSSFLSDQVSRLGLTNCRVVVERAEICGHLPEYRESFDCCTARAVAELRVLLEYSLPFLKDGGNGIYWKGSRWEEEIQDSAHALDVLCGRVVETHEYKWPNDVTRMLLKIRKEGVCPEKYPRRTGIPSKRPL